MTIEPIPFNWPYASGKELVYVAEAQRNHHLSGDGPFTKRCQQWIEQQTGCAKALLTHSCTSALDLAALLLDIKNGDEVILPSYTFVSTANAFVLRGAIPVFVDIREDTLNLDERLIEDAITPRTRAIVPVHYAGVSCEMDTINAIARRHNLRVVEDAAQGVMASYKGRALGALGDLGSFSFHETKNVTSGEGGSLLVNDPAWSCAPKSFAKREPIAADSFEAKSINIPGRMSVLRSCPAKSPLHFCWPNWKKPNGLPVDDWRSGSATTNCSRRWSSKACFGDPSCPLIVSTTGICITYSLHLKSIARQVLDELKRNKIHAVFHYVPLHSSPAGMRFGRSHGDLSLTTSLSQRLIRLPMWFGLSEAQQQRVVDVLSVFLRR